MAVLNAVGPDATLLLMARKGGARTVTEFLAPDPLDTDMAALLRKDVQAAVSRATIQYTTRPPTANEVCVTVCP